MLAWCPSISSVEEECKHLPVVTAGITVLSPGDFSLVAWCMYNKLTRLIAFSNSLQSHTTTAASPLHSLLGSVWAFPPCHLGATLKGLWISTAPFNPGYVLLSKANSAVILNFLTLNWALKVWYDQYEITSGSSGITGIRAHSHQPDALPTPSAALLLDCSNFQIHFLSDLLLGTLLGCCRE